MEGKNRAVYKYYKNDEFIAEGTVHEIAEGMGLKPHSLWNKVSRCKKGKSKRVKHELVKVRNSVFVYLLVNNNKIIGEGTLTELSEISNYSLDYLTRISNGSYIRGENNNLKIYKQVGS
ncbi:hypothetical protein Goe4_c00180 [Bacillus phage vB_BthP-Goe4]|uniref:Uncharacterized protein n=1 Tax=Bacillus phage vB_BthP-Goe4 TaxID=2315470 RepID=A0A386KTA4_9CAUD|nr:host nuclease inhibitor [Bacillus phage vB_BthP-Goe4]AYD87727.1 hypothetical protein Goe4_c00180 [Bacillus phage vB_BthP-Goe4]AZV00067.1 hypothetical protein [Bacillus phage vB_BthP-HD73phi]